MFFNCSDVGERVSELWPKNRTKLQFFVDCGTNIGNLLKFRVSNGSDVYKRVSKLRAIKHAKWLVFLVLWKKIQIF